MKVREALPNLTLFSRFDTRKQDGNQFVCFLDKWTT